jgi:glyoxylase-like metal-dependent hydrolase (beta-lactamase superfamily II)
MAWPRRDFLKASSLAAVAGVLPRAAAAQQPAAAPPAPALFTQLRRNVGIFNQRGGTIGWLVSADGVLVVDSQFADTAPNLLSGLKERSPRQIDVLVNSHHHPDHTGGNGVLRPAAKQIVAHVRSSENQKAQAERMKAQTTLPDHTFAETWSVTIGDETIRARHWGPAHTGGDVSIHFEQANVVHLGDLLNNRGYPNVDAPAGASVHGWMQVLEKMAKAYPADALFVYGHAEAGYPFIGTRPDLYYQRDYFAAVVEMAGKARKEGKSRDELAKVEVLPKFEHFGGQKPRLGLALTIAYDELAKIG